jgi:hypothetical protein
MSTPPIQSSDIPGFVDLPQDVDEAAGGQATTEAAGDADGEPDNHPRGPGHSSEHGDFYHANRMQQQLFGGGANGAQPQGSGASQAQAQAQADATPPRHGEGPHGDRPRHDGTPRGEGHRGSDGPRGGEGGYRGDGPRGGDSPPGQQRPGNGPDGTPNGHSQRNASTQPGNNVLPGNPATGNGRVDGQQMPPWAGVPGMGASHGHGGGFGQLGSFVGQALGHLLGGTGHAASMLLRPGEGLLPGLPFHAGNTAPNLPHLPATVVDTVRTATQGVTQALPGANAPAQVAHQPTTLPNEAASAQPRTPLQSGTNSTSTQNTTAAHEASMPLRGTNAPTQQQAPTTTISAQAAQATATSPTRTATAAGETMHASPTAASNRSPLAESASPAAGPRTPHGVENPALNTQAAAQNAARGAPGMQAVQAIQSGTLTLAFAPQIAASIDDGAEALNHTALFRGQGADGAESLRDILGRNYVFSADGKLAMRAEERRAVDPVQASRTEAIDEDRFANDGELSTHELVWKVVVPAFVGVGTLLGGAAVGVATAAGSTGMASAFLLVAAASILGYGAVRAGTALREMADAGQRIHPLENPAARTQWLAAGSQSLGSVISLALLLV